MVLLEKKICKKCSEEKLSSEYYSNYKGRLHIKCKECECAEQRARNLKNKKNRSDYHKEWRLKNRGSDLLKNARFRAKQRNLLFEIDKEFVKSKIETGVCELTGIPFDFSKPRAWNAPSLDQIIAGEGYTKTNTRLVLYAVNTMLNTWGVDIVLNIAEAIKNKGELSV